MALHARLCRLEPIAEQGCLMAVSNMGSCFLNGEGVRKEPRRAMDWYERAANEGFAPSQCYLGVMFESGSCKEVGKDDARAADYFEKAAAQNFKYACYNVAVCYEQGTQRGGEARFGRERG
jgi:TPR repeat protein